LEDVDKILHCGADKIAINTAAVKNPDLIKEVADKYGSQCMVLSIQAKKRAENKWEAYYDNGREHTGLDVVEWAKRGYELGAGEILLTSVDREGTKKGFDLELIRQVSEAVPIPVIACGGMSRPEDFVDAVEQGKADAVAVASILHYNEFSIDEIKDCAEQHEIDVRR
jgi:cyclase